MFGLTMGDIIVQRNYRLNDPPREGGPDMAFTYWICCECGEIVAKSVEGCIPLGTHHLHGEVYYAAFACRDRREVTQYRATLNLSKSFTKTQDYGKGA